VTGEGGGEGEGGTGNGRCRQGVPGEESESHTWWQETSTGKAQVPFAPGVTCLLCCRCYCCLTSPVSHPMLLLLLSLPLLL
jgi:hypothetical protein